jgi:hypothetical protein
MPCPRCGYDLTQSLIFGDHLTAPGLYSMGTGHEFMRDAPEERKVKIEFPAPKFKPTNRAARRRAAALARK